MRAVHSFFLADFEHVADPEGLVEHLMSNVIDGQCLYCRATSSFSSPQAAQQHMIAKAHCKMRASEDGVDELDQYYEYSSASEGDDDDGGGGGGDDGAVVVYTPAGRAVKTEADDLVLPSGERLVHRRWMRYYKQHFTLPSERLTAQLDRLALDYQAAGVAGPGAIGGAGGGGRLGLARRMELSVGTRGKAVVPTDQKREERYRSRFGLAIGMGMNQIRRKYFRVQMLE